MAETMSWLLGIGLVCGLGIIVVNLMALITIARTQLLWTPSHIYVASLAVTDLLTGCTLILFTLTVVPGYAEVMFTQDGICITIMFCMAICTFASILTFTVVSVDRFVSISYPFFYDKATNKRVIVIVVVVWLIAALLASLMIVFKVLDNIPICVWNYPIESEVYIFCIAFYLCMVVSATMYALVSRLALRHLREIAAHQVAAAWAESVAPMRETFRQKVRAMKMFVVILGVFCLFWTPYVVASTIHHVSSPLSISVLDFTYLIGLLNSVCNIFIYMSLNAEFRVAYKRLFTGQ